MADLDHTDAPNDASQGDAAATADDLDLRSRPRHLCGTIALTKLSLPAAAVTYFAWVHDISESGIGLDLLSRLGAGAEIVFELKGSTDNEKIRLHAQVVHTTAVGAFYRLGCRFMAPLRPAVLATIMGKMRGHD
jgi:hypothetical protein